MSWIKDKAHLELARIREAREKQVYPFFKPFESGLVHLKHVVYFVGVTYVALFCATRVLEARRWK